MIQVCEEELRHLYIDEHLPMHKIGNILGVSIGTVYNKMKLYGISSRSQKESFTFAGRSHSNKARMLISKAHSGKTVSKESRKKISDSKKMGGIGHKKLTQEGYVRIYFPDHPRASKDGYILEHILVMEALLGRHLKENECVHHINQNKRDNRKENLMLLTNSEHMRLHSKERWEKRRNDLSIE